MTMYDYIIGKKYLQTPIILKTAKENLYQKAMSLKRKNSNQNAELELYLQDKFYGDGENESEVQAFYDKILDIYQRETGQAIISKSDNWGTVPIAKGALSKEKLMKQGRIFEHKAQIQRGTLAKRLFELTRLDQIIPMGSEEFREVKNKIEKCIKAIKEIITENTGQDDTTFFKFSSQKDIDRVREIDNLYKQILLETKAGPIDCGKLFEYGLAYIDSLLSGNIENIADELTSKIGSRTVKREGLDLQLIFDKQSNTKKKRTGIEETKSSSLKVGGITVKTNFLEAVQGKADVTLTLPSNNITYNISAKNWSEIEKSGNKYGFGDASIIGAVVRSSKSSSVMEHFLYAAGPREACAAQLNAMHEYIQLCLATDIIMGLSQMNFNRAADTIVINDRKERKIHVYSATDLVNELIKKKSNILYFDNYNFDEIRLKIKEQFEEQKRWNVRHSNSYKANVINHLNSIRVEIKMRTVF